MIIISPTDEHIRLKTYDATMKGKVTTLRITIEVTDPYALAHVLRDLEELTAASKRRPTKPEPEPKPAKTSKKIAHQQMLMLPDFSGGERE